MQEYYDWSDCSRLCRAAIALHPGKRLTCFEQQWLNEQDGKRDVANAKKATKDLWQQHLRNLPPPQQLHQIPCLQPPPTQTNRTLNDESDDEDYQAAFGSYTTPLATVRQQELDCEAELADFIKAETSLPMEYADKPLQW
ncbi:hypothetical protein LTR49_026378 [Elasticomyces elasticus]|nr:hypothetical protein LTR49_026378 [Elasticomyces elasticus]